MTGGGGADLPREGLLGLAEGLFLVFQEEIVPTLLLFRVLEQTRGKFNAFCQIS